MSITNEVAKEALDSASEAVQSGFRYNPQFFALVLLVVIFLGAFFFTSYQKDQHDTQNMTDQNKILSQIQNELVLIHDDHLKMISNQEVMNHNLDKQYNFFMFGKKSYQE